MKRYHILSVELPGREPPREFRIFPFGRIETIYGIFVFDAISAQLVMERWREWGNRLSIDYEHGALNPHNAGPAPAAGWFDLEVRDDGLWAVNVDWTPRAREMLLQGEYRYFSPAFEMDENGRIVGLINIALTNLPATKHMEPLVTKAVAFEEGPVHEGSWDADAAVGRVRRWASRDGSGDKDTIDWAKYRRAFAWYDASNPENFGSYKLPHHDVVDGRLVVHKRGVMAAAAVLQGARGGVDIPASEMEAVRRHIAAHYHQWGEKAPWEHEEASRRTGMEKTLRLLGLGPEASDAEAEAVVRRLMAFPERVFALTNTRREDEAEAVILAWRQAAEELPRVQERLNQLEEERRRERLNALIERGKREGKLTPAMLSWAQEQTPEALERFLEVAPRVIHLGGLEEPPVGQEGMDWNRLTPAQRAELYRDNPEVYRALRKRALGY